MDSQSTFVFAASSLPGCDPLFLAWMAGFVDGEGTLTISVDRTVNAEPQYRTQLTVANTARAPLDEIAQRTGVGRVRTAWTNPRQTKPCFSWAVTGPSARRVAAAIRPYLRIKGAQADILIAFRTVPAVLRAGTGSSPRALARNEARKAIKCHQSESRDAIRRLNGRDPT